MTMIRLPDVIWGRPFPKITIDHEKCTVPFLCKKCLRVCPTGVFGVVRVMKREERLKEMDPRVDGNYVFDETRMRRDKCLVCNKCIEVCPVDAIKIEMPTVDSAKPEVKGVHWST